jgi:hypothetical protein
MLIFHNSNTTWWQKPLVTYNGRHLPAEIAVLFIELKKNEHGVWINSRKCKTGVIDLEEVVKGYKTRRIEIPSFVSNTIEEIYKSTRKQMGCPDLVIWNPQSKNIRFVEVKCPHWDRIREGQREFIQQAKSIGINTKILEWQFNNAQPAAEADRQGA